MIRRRTAVRHYLGRKYAGWQFVDGSLGMKVQRMEVDTDESWWCTVIVEGHDVAEHLWAPQWWPMVMRRYKLVTLQVLQAHGNVVTRSAVAHDGASTLGSVVTHGGAVRMVITRDSAATCLAGDVALQWWWVMLSKFLFLVGSFNRLFYTRERKRKRKWKTPLCTREKKKKRARKRKKERTLKPVWSHSSSCWFSSNPSAIGWFSTTQAPSSSHNTSRTTTRAKRKSRTQNQKKFVAFNIKQQRSFSRIELQRRNEDVMCVDGGRVVTTVSI